MRAAVDPGTRTLATVLLGDLLTRGFEKLRRRTAAGAWFLPSCSSEVEEDLLMLLHTQEHKDMKVGGTDAEVHSPHEDERWGDGDQAS
jgi:hypothetical protein